MTRPRAPAAERNRDPILRVLEREFAHSRSILEIGSGTGQHAAWFARKLTHLRWQPSDLADQFDGIRSWVDDAGLPNLRMPLVLDVSNPPPPVDAYDGMFSANTAHIMDMDAVRAMIRLAGRLPSPGSRFCLYGPFRIEGAFTSASNSDFDASLRARNPAMGIRDLETLDELARDAGMERTALYAMPANNFLAVWRRC